MQKRFQICKPKGIVTRVTRKPCTKVQMPHERSFLQRPVNPRMKLDEYLVFTATNCFTWYSKGNALQSREEDHPPPITYSFHHAFFTLVQPGLGNEQHLQESKKGSSSLFYEKTCHHDEGKNSTNCKVALYVPEKGALSTYSDVVSYLVKTIPPRTWKLNQIERSWNFFGSWTVCRTRMPKLLLEKALGRNAVYDEHVCKGNFFAKLLTSSARARCGSGATATLQMCERWIFTGLP